MKTVICSPEELQTVIEHHQAKGANFARLLLSCPVRDALKKHRITKQPNTIGEIVKHSDLNVVINFDYAGNVNRQRVREDKAADFTAQANWFEHVSPAIVEHKQTRERYAFVRVLKNLSAPRFTVDGEEIAREQIASVLPASDLNDAERAQYGIAAKAPSAVQDLDAEIAPIAIKLANVRELHVDGFAYVVLAEGEATVIVPDRVSTTRPAQVPATV